MCRSAMGASPTISGFERRSRRCATCWRPGPVSLPAPTRPPNGEPDPAYSVEPEAGKLARGLPEVTLLDNLRFDPGDGECLAFVETLIEGHDAYVNDAFEHPTVRMSIVGPPQFLPSAAGRLLHQEVEVLGGMNDRPRPFVAVMAGRRSATSLRSSRPCSITSIP